MFKKYLFGSLTALATLAFFASCNNEDAFDSSKDINVAKYEMAFKAVFGNPAPTQDWGFGPATTRGTRAITVDHQFPDAAPADAYKSSTDLPVEDRVSGGGNHAIGENTKYVELYSSGNIFVVGNVTPSEKFYIAGNSNLYITNGATLNIGTFSYGQYGSVIYVAEGGTLNVTGSLQMSQTKIYNKGTINISDYFQACNAGLIYNDGGKINVENRLSVENANANIVNNAGIITAGELATQGGGSMENNDSIIINGSTYFNSNNNTWVNNGQFITEDFDYTAGSSTVINNCKMTVTNLFKINLGDNDVNGFRMDGGSGVVTKDFEMAGPARIYMGSNSVFKVTGEAKMNITKAGYGIYGPETGDFAVFQANEITCNNVRQGFNVTYFNNLYVVANEHFAFCYSDKSDEQVAAGEIGNQPNYSFVGAAVLYTDGQKPGITIEKTPCNPGFGGGDEFTPVIRVMAEDLTITSTGANSDFDFNDIVFDVQWTSTGAKVRINAAGGTLPLTIGGAAGGLGTEVHAAFKEANPTKNITVKTMMNTFENHKSDYVRPIINLTGNFVNAETGQKDANLIKLFVNKGTEDDPKWIELTAVKGKVASKIGVDPKVEWCNERQGIDSRYDKFPAWVRGEVEVFY